MSIVLRTLIPVGAVLSTATVLAVDWGLNHGQMSFFYRDDGVFRLFGAMFVFGLLVPVHQALRMALLSGLFSTAYVYLVKFAPGLQYADCPFAPVALSAWVTVAILENWKHQVAVRNYFLCRESGSVADIAAFTSLPEKIINRQIDEFIRREKLVLMLETPAVYRWTEIRDYPEGMQSTTIEIKM